MKKVEQITLEEAARKINTGDTIVVGGFGMTGNPVHLLNALANTETKELTYIGNNVGEPGLGGGRLLRNGQLKKAIGSFFTSNHEVVSAYQSGELEVELLPQGTLAEALRAGGAGLGGFYTPTSVNTVIAEKYEKRNIGGKDMVLIPPLRANVALIRAWKGDTAGNLQYRMTESNFNTSAATAADIVIAEVEEIVPLGDLDPNAIHTPGCFVDYLIEAKLKPEDLGTSMSINSGEKKIDESRINIAKAALAEISAGDVVNLGIGIPTLVADLISPDDDITIHTENGMLGVGPKPKSGGAMDYPVNAGKIPVTAIPGSSYFDSANSFAMIRGGHIDVAVMGALQVDESGNLANWAIPGKPLLGVGGAMDLAQGAKKLVITLIHSSRDGQSKIVPQCTLPLTALGVVDTVISDLAVFRFKEKNGKKEMVLVKLAPNVTLDDIALKTTASYKVELE